MSDRQRQFSEWLMARCVVVSAGFASPCWLWNRYRQGDGYAHAMLPVALFEPKVARVHRVAYQELVGAIGPGLHLDHLCRNRACCNPAHLEPVTPGENARRTPDDVRRAALAKAQLSLPPKWRPWSHCKQGHPMTPENTESIKNGRRCRICHRAANATRDRRKKAATQ